MAEKDVSNFTSSSSHRLPTVSAAEVLQKLSSQRHSTISTGLPQLDETLLGRGSMPITQHAATSGLTRGQVVEIYGPPAVGKTTMAMQMTASALHTGGSVVWIDTAHALVTSRLTEIISQYQWLFGAELPSSPPAAGSTSDLLQRFHYFAVTTLAHLLALLMHPLTSFPPDHTSIIVIDTISPLFATAFPRVIENFDNNQTPAKKHEAAQWAAGRRYAVMGDFVSRLGKLATIRNIAILLISQTTTKVRGEKAAILRPSITTKSWDEGISTRIVLFRDWISRDCGASQKERPKAVRFAAVVKLGGALYDGMATATPFTIEKTGLREVEEGQSTGQPIDLPIIQGPILKRKRDEVADSQSEEDDIGSDEEYGWAGDDLLAADDLSEDPPDVDDSAEQNEYQEEE